MFKLETHVRQINNKTTLKILFATCVCSRPICLFEAKSNICPALIALQQQQ